MESPPDWAMCGILVVETRSSYLTTPGTPITYVDQSVGKDGERGPFQMTRIAFRQVAKGGESFSRLESDTRYAEQFAVRYLCWLYENAAKGDWSVAVGMYNTGPTGWHRNQTRAANYVRKVRRAGGG
jgi:hypothetical protein